MVLMFITQGHLVADLSEFSRDLILLMKLKYRVLHQSWSSTVKMEASQRCHDLFLQFHKIKQSASSNTGDNISLQEKKFSMEPQMAK